MDYNGENACDGGAEVQGAVMGVYARGEKLWIRFRDIGATRFRATW
jgi:hypothetical protein